MRISGHFSTNTFFIGLTDYVKGKIGKGNLLVRLVVIDLRKAFDTADGKILIEKLSLMRVTVSIARKWIELILLFNRSLTGYTKEASGPHSVFMLRQLYVMCIQMSPFYIRRQQRPHLQWSQRGWYRFIKKGRTFLMQEMAGGQLSLLTRGKD